MHVISHVMSSTIGSCSDVQYYELLPQGSFASFCGVHHDKQFSVLNFWGWCHVSVDGTIIKITFSISVLQPFITKVNETLNMHAKWRFSEILCEICTKGGGKKNYWSLHSHELYHLHSNNTAFNCDNSFNFLDCVIFYTTLS